MTWRELIRTLQTYSQDVLDMEALVWLNGDDDFYTGEHPIIGIAPYDQESIVNENNKLSIDVR